MIRTILLVLSYFLITGCNAFDQNNALLQHVYSADGKQDYYSLSLNQKTNNLVIGRESGLHFEIEPYNFKLPSQPKEQTIYPSERLIINHENEYSSRPKSEIVSGTVQVDISSQLVVVSLNTRNGVFPGNGKYLLKCLSCEHLIMQMRE
jgi:hypothetical protein